MLRWVTVAVLVLSLGAGAQTRRKPKSARPTAATPADPSAWPIESIAVEGNKVYSKAQIVAISGIRVESGPPNPISIQHGNGYWRPGRLKRPAANTLHRQAAKDTPRKLKWWK